MKNEGALKVRFLRHAGIYRSDVSYHLVNLGRSAAFRSGPSQAIGRAGRNTPCPSSAMSSGRLFLDRVARLHGPSPLHRHHQLKTIAAWNGNIYHRTVTSLLTVCLSSGDKPIVSLLSLSVHCLGRTISKCFKNRRSTNRARSICLM